MERKIEQLVESTINDLGFNIVKIAINGSANKVVEIFIEKLDGEKIYYSAKDKTNKEVVDEMKETLPDILYK